MKIGLLGFGVVGRGVYDIVADRDDIQVAKVVCLEDITLPDAEVTKDFKSVLADDSIDTNSCKEISRPISAVIYKTCLLCRYLQRLRKDDTLDTLLYLFCRNTAHILSLIRIIQITQLIFAPATHIFKHQILLISPT